MTRFARAKGSKSSNERVPEQPTSWSEMRKELLRESVRKAAEEQIERESQSLPSKLCLDGLQPGSSFKTNVAEPLEFASFDDDNHDEGQFSGASNEIVKQKSNKKAKNHGTSPQKKRKFMNHNVDQTSFNEDHISSPLIQCSSVKEDDTLHNSSSQTIEQGQQHSKKLKSEKFQHTPRNNADQGRSLVNNERKLKKEAQKKDEEDDDSLLKISGNFKGYPVPKEDAETLDDAYKTLRKEGLTHKQAMEQIKPERRRAEKRLARLKSMVCFRCRKTGHRLSDCPLADVECDVCFKCGSTTHKFKDCKKKGSFVNAKCFVCGVTGHLSSQCPDNPLGVYPQGGQCKICGEKSHLVKDCPQNRNKKEIHPGTTEFDDYFDNNVSTAKEPKGNKLKKVQF